MDAYEMFEDTSPGATSPSSSSDSIANPLDLKELLNKLFDDATALEGEIRGLINHADTSASALTALCIGLSQDGYHAEVAVPKASRIARLRGNTPTSNGRTVYVSSYQPYARIALQPPPRATESTIYPFSPPTTLPGNALGASLWDVRNDAKVPTNRAVYTCNSASSSSSASDCLSGRSSSGSSTGGSDTGDGGCNDTDVIVVELQLRDLFRVAPALEEYNTLLNLIPEVWVGSVSRLQQLVKRMCEEIDKNYRLQGMDVPPWRRFDAFLRRWELGACTVQLPIVPAPSSAFATITTRSTVTVPDFD